MTETPVTGESVPERRTDDSERSIYRPDSLGDIRETYAENAETLARMHWFDRLFMGRYRRKAFGEAEGHVLDVACGIGTNLQYLPETVTYVGIDISPDMLELAEERFERLKRGVTVLNMDAQDLDFHDDSFDTVISSLSTCTFPDPVAALEEMNRACAPDGKVLLLEHGRSSVRPIARFQDWRADAHYEKHSCRWDQNPLGIVAESPLEVKAFSTHLAGTITIIQATPTK